MNLRDVLKRFLTIFLPLSVLLVSIAVAFYYTDVGTEMTIIEANEISNVSLQKKIIVDNFKSIVSDLMILSNQLHLQRMFEGRGNDNINDLAYNFLSFSKRKGLYDQIRFLDETGMEIVRVNFNNGKPFVVPKDKLQFKGNRYYFKNTIKLNNDEVFVSPFDLNIEDGKIEQPIKPMIRFGTPVFDSQARKRGIMVLNFLGTNLIEDLQKVSVNLPGHIMLLNSNGYWLYGRRAEDNWGFMFEHGKDRTFRNAFPRAWEQISISESGQLHIGDGMFTFTTIHPLLAGGESSTGPDKALNSNDYIIEAKNYYWKIVSHMLPNVLYAKSRKSLGRLFLLYTILFVFLAISSWYLAHLSGQKIIKHKKSLSPFNILVTIAILIFFSELLIIFILHYLNPSTPLIEGLIDSTLLTVLITPALYFLSFRPLINHINERKNLENKLRIITVTDELTGLSNRRGFFSFAQQQLKIANRMKRSMLLFFADLDQLKSINDSLGHHKGDDALIETAGILKETFRESDIIARIGGDEFVVLIVDASKTNENIITSRLQKHLENFNKKENSSYKLSLSTGLVIYNPEHGGSLDELIAKADKLMYAQKLSKR